MLPQEHRQADALQIYIGKVLGKPEVNLCVVNRRVGDFPDFPISQLMTMHQDVDIRSRQEQCRLFRKRAYHLAFDAVLLHATQHQIDLRSQPLAPGDAAGAQNFAKGTVQSHCAMVLEAATKWRVPSRIPLVNADYPPAKAPERERPRIPTFPPGFEASRVADALASRVEARWHQQSVDLDQQMLTLSTCLGHAKVSNTYWYVSALPELMAIVGKRLEHFVDPWDGLSRGRR